MASLHPVYYIIATVTMLVLITTLLEYLFWKLIYHSYHLPASYETRDNLESIILPLFLIS